MTIQNFDPLIASAKAAALLGIQPQTLRARRMRGDSPAFVRIGSRAYYKQSVIEQYLAERTFASTSDEAASNATR